MTDWNRELALVGSENRMPVLIAALQATAEEEGKRELLAEWINMCEAYAPWREPLREQMELAGFFTDDEDGASPLLPIIVYRAAREDDEAERALSWTTKRSVAEFFCRHHTSFRAMFLGLYRADVDIYIWQATCHEMYGWIVGRGESEVLAKTLTDVEQIAVAVRERKE